MLLEVGDGEQVNLGILSRGLARKKTDLVCSCMTQRSLIINWEKVA